MATNRWSSQQLLKTLHLEIVWQNLCEPIAIDWLAIPKSEVVQQEVSSSQLGNPRNLLQVTQYPHPDLATRNTFMTLPSSSRFLDDSYEVHQVISVSVR